MTTVYDMMAWIIGLLVLAMIAALLGFSGLAAGFASLAKLVAGLFVVLLVASLFYSFFASFEDRSDKHRSQS